MTTVWSSDEPYDWDAEDAFDEDDYPCLTPERCGDPCVGACYDGYGNAASYP